MVIRINDNPQSVAIPFARAGIIYCNFTYTPTQMKIMDLLSVCYEGVGKVNVR